MTDDFSTAHDLIYKLKEWNVSVHQSQLDTLVKACYEALMNARSEGYANGSSDTYNEEKEQL